MALIYLLAEILSSWAGGLLPRSPCRNKPLVPKHMPTDSTYIYSRYRRYPRSLHGNSSLQNTELGAKECVFGTTMQMNRTLLIAGSIGVDFKIFISIRSRILKERDGGVRNSGVWFNKGEWM